MINNETIMVLYVRGANDDLRNLASLYHEEI